MWTARCEKLTDAGGLHIAVYVNSRVATFADALHGWQTDAGFRLWFNALLADASYSAFRWETPAVTSATVTRPFEFVIMDEPALARRPDPKAFAEHFHTSPKTGVVEFPNLRGDASLVVPCPVVSSSAYGHLAAFVRQSPESQRHALWELVGAAMTRRISKSPVWLSTAGAGVSWLHVRLDDQPKYYGHEPYRLQSG